MPYATITVEGGLLPVSLLERIAQGEAEGQQPADFGPDVPARLRDEIQSAFSDVTTYWDAFQRRLAYSRESRTTLTRGSWIIPLLERLGFTLVPQRSAIPVGSETYAISHLAGENPDAPPVHIVSIEQSLDRREGARRSPYGLVQEYLNRSDALWGIVTNGEQLRLIRASARTAGPVYLDVDLRAMVQGNHYSEFVLLYRVLHRSRFPRGSADAHECLLERYYQQGIEEGGRVRERLRDGVEKALLELGNAFLIHPESEGLRERLRTGQLDASGYYRQLLRLVYRFVFLFVVEERQLVFPSRHEHADRQPIYREHYSLSRLRERCERYFANDHYSDLWPGLLQTFRLLRDADAARQLGLTALDGELFGQLACPDLEAAACENARLLAALRFLSTFDDHGVRRRVNYAALDVEELGSVYESLLEYQPRVAIAGQSEELADAASRRPPPAAAFELVYGSERKQTGSYYTPPELVRELIRSALLPVMEERLARAKTPEEKERALLGLRVCDPASGSGHFLLAAARRIGRELARARTGDEEPPPDAYRLALRDVIRHCIYAVDKNPLAVDLCKVALWIEGHEPGLALSFLDHHVKHGDSLVGVFDLAALEQGIPDEAYTPVTGDDKSAAASYRALNRQERNGQLSYEGALAAPELPAALADDFETLAALDDRTPADVGAKRDLYAALRARGSRWWDDKVACDLWTAAFFLPLRPVPGGARKAVPTTEIVRRSLRHPQGIDQELAGRAIALSERHPFFHWPLEFPEVFAEGGFDVVLGNPPWERVKLQEEEFFAGRDPEIARAPNKAARERLIRELPGRNPALAREFADARHDAEAESRFLRTSGRFPRCGRGDINTYAVFAEAMRSLLGPTGRAGLIVPTGIATDDTTKHFFRDLIDSRALVSLYDFENRRKLFPAVHGSYKFCLLTLAGQQRPASDGAEFAFFLLGVEDLREAERRFVLTPDDLALLNPNTRTCPIFRGRRDAELTKAIYRRVPVLVKEGPPEVNPWGISFTAMFHMSNDSHLFRTRDQLESAGWRLEGNVFARGSERYLPLYEAKLIHQFDHRWATYADGDIRDLTTAEKADPACLALPRYWVPAAEVEARLAGRWDRQWLIGWRDITNATNERTVIASVVPRVGVGNNLPLMLTTASPGGLLTANLSSFVLDFAARFKVGGTHLNFFIFQQLPVLPPATYERPCPWAPGERLADWMTRRVLELTYTAWDLQPFARDLGDDGPPFSWDEERRFLLRCELDAAFFHLYGVAREDVAYILETFPIVKRKDEERFGEYRTRRVILEVYDRMQRAMDSAAQYQTRLHPPPGYRRAAQHAREAV